LALQLGDLASTLLFLRHGVVEANPLVAAAVRVCGRPTVALVLVKAVGCGLAVYAWRSRRTRLLRRANLFFALCVGWNLLAIAIA
jgi:pyridoxine/pyridoxamine 5'-phosphate oxidase